MGELNIQNLVQKLIERTKNGAVSWGFGHEKDSYRFLFSSGNMNSLFVEISEQCDPDDNNIVIYYLTLSTEKDWIVSCTVDLFVNGVSSNADNICSLPSCNGIGELYQIVKEQIQIKLQNLLNAYGEEK